MKNIYLIFTFALLSFCTAVAQPNGYTYTTKLRGEGRLIVPKSNRDICLSASSDGTITTQVTKMKSIKPDSKFTIEGVGYDVYYIKLSGGGLLSMDVDKGEISVVQGAPYTANFKILPTGSAGVVRIEAEKRPGNYLAIDSSGKIFISKDKYGASLISIARLNN